MSCACCSSISSSLCSVLPFLSPFILPLLPLLSQKEERSGARRGEEVVVVVVVEEDQQQEEEEEEEDEAKGSAPVSSAASSGEVRSPVHVSSAEQPPPSSADAEQQQQQQEEEEEEEEEGGGTCASNNSSSSSSSSSSSTPVSAKRMPQRRPSRPLPQRFAEADRVTFGVLLKKGGGHSIGGRRSWKRREFRIDVGRHELSWFEPGASKGGGERLGYIPLAGSTLREVVDEKHPFRFQVSPPARIGALQSVARAVARTAHG
jgi:hypothetical protein